MGYINKIHLEYPLKLQYFNTDNLEQQLKKREKELKKFEAELILLIKKTNEESFQSKFKSSSKTLDDILSCQRSSSNKNGLDYDN